MVKPMNDAARRTMTREDFLLWLEAQEGRWEFDGFEPVAMTGGTNNHGTISGNIHAALRQSLRGGPCRPMTAESGGVATVGTKVRYPDVTVTCSPVGGRDRLIPEPVVVFEVASVGSKYQDHMAKALEYQAVASIRCYLVVEQARRSVRVLRRDGDGPWTQPEAVPLTSGELDLPWLGVSLSLDAIYEDVDFQT